jgi:thiol-disulfide isomerase/thioredoxin
MKKTLLVLLTCLAVGCGQPSAKPQAATPAGPDLKIANQSAPGERMELTSCLVPGKTTLIEFYSDSCPPCHEMARVLDNLAQHKPELAVRRLSIDRRGSAGIDWDSPLAEQYHVDVVPAFRVYGPTGKLTADGSAAKDLVREWYYEVQMMSRGESDPGTREIMDRYRE